MSTTRRHFLTSGASLAGAALAANSAAQTRATSANDRLRFALIGAGGMGSEDTDTELSLGSELVAVCDVYQGRLDRAKERWGSHLFTTRDFREVLTRKDIDFVVIATPDHWHVPIAIAAMEAGKDMYLQKPVVHDLEQGPQIIGAARRTKRIVEIGSERVSSVTYQKAKELFRSGAIGELTMVEAYWRRNSALGAWQYSIPPDASPQTVDWDRFLGDAPKRPFDPIRLFRWRNYRDYGTGVAGDLFVHMFTGLHYVIGSNGPTRVVAMGGLRFWKDGRDVPDVMMAMCEYPKTANHPEFNLSLSLNFKAGSGEESGMRLIGTEGVMLVSPNLTVLNRVQGESQPGYSIQTFTKGMQEEYLKEYRKKYPPKKASSAELRPVSEERYPAPRGYDEDSDHHANLLASIRSRKPVVEDEVFGYRAAAPALLCNQSLWQRKPLDWDPEAMTLKRT